MVMILFKNPESPYAQREGALMNNCITFGLVEWQFIRTRASPLYSGT